MPPILPGKGTDGLGLELGARCIVTLGINDAVSGCGAFVDATAGLAAPQMPAAAAG